MNERDGKMNIIEKNEKNKINNTRNSEEEPDWNRSNEFLRSNYSENNINILENTVSQLKSIGYEIQSEISIHLGIIDDINFSIDSTNRRIKISQKILNRLVNMASTTTLIFITFLLFILLVLQWLI